MSSMRAEKKVLSCKKVVAKFRLQGKLKSKPVVGSPHMLLLGCVDRHRKKFGTRVPQFSPENLRAIAKFPKNGFRTALVQSDIFFWMATGGLPLAGAVTEVSKYTFQECRR